MWSLGQKVHLFQVCLLCKTCRFELWTWVSESSSVYRKKLTLGFSWHNLTKISNVGQRAALFHIATQGSRLTEIPLFCSWVIWNLWFPRLHQQEKRARKCTYWLSTVFIQKWHIELTRIQFSSSSALKITFQPLAIKSTPCDLFWPMSRKQQ